MTSNTKPPAEQFSEAQKQYLCGFTYGTDIARAVRGLPVLSNSSAGANGTTVTVGGSDGAGKVTLPAGPDQPALEAQQAVLSAGKKLSKEEEAKRAKNGLDLWGEIQQRCDAAEFPKGTDVFLQKFHGLFYVAPAQDSYMCRMRIPGGMLRDWQLRGIADLSDRAAGGYLDVTTRANLQLREIAARDGMEVLYGLRELDIVTTGSGADNIRNCTASSLSGIDPSELIETIPLAKRMHHYILNHREMYGLPRKFNIAFDGGGQISALDDTNDIGFHAVRVTEQMATESVPAGVYFQLTLGGITGHRDFARDTGVLLQPDECITVAGAIVRVFLRHGDRTDRKRARLKYLLDAWGFDKFIAEVERELGTPTPLRRGLGLEAASPEAEDRFSHVGFHPQKQPDRFYVGVVLPVGRITSDQARRLADIAQQYGNGEVRLTVWQNVIVPGIERSDLDVVAAQLEAIGLEHRASSFRAGLVACTGNAGCKFAAADTKRHALEIAATLESHFDLDTPINIHLTGCHHSCAQHYIGDIGLLACKVEQGDDMVEGYHVHVGGGWGARQNIARLLYESVPMSELPELIVALVRNYLQHRSPGESFADFANRHSDHDLRELNSVAA